MSQGHTDCSKFITRPKLIFSLDKNTSHIKLNKLNDEGGYHTSKCNILRSYVTQPLSSNGERLRARGYTVI